MLCLDVQVLDGKRRISPHVQQLVFIMLAHAVGEYDLETRIAAVNFVENFDKEDEVGVLTVAQLPSLINEYYGLRSTRL